MSKKKPPTLVLLDSCTYFRLGISIRPLLSKLTGDPEYTLKVLAELDKEFNKNPRLKTKFWWASDKEHADERATHYYIPKGKKAQTAKVAFSFITQYAIDNGVAVSFVDKHVLSAGYACGGIVVTDDIAMQGIAETFGIRCFGTLELLQLMYTRGKASLEDIDAVLEYWKYEKDVPTSFASIEAWRMTIDHND